MMGGIEMIMMTFVPDKRAFPGTSRWGLRWCPGGQPPDELGRGNRPRLRRATSQAPKGYQFAGTCLIEADIGLTIKDRCLRLIPKSSRFSVSGVTGRISVPFGNATCRSSGLSLTRGRTSQPC